MNPEYIFDFSVTPGWINSCSAGGAYIGQYDGTPCFFDAVDFKGWNLVGNPWGVKAYPNHAFYTMAEGGAAIDVTPSVAGTEVAPMTGIFVVAEAAHETVTFATENPNSKSANLALNVTNSSKLIDRAIVRFGEEQQLPKFQLNPKHTKLYMPVDNKDFAVVNASGNFCIFGIEGEATVQVIDMLGHVISSETFSGSYERKINGAPGVYLVRLINGENVRVQKVVVR